MLSFCTGLTHKSRMLLGFSVAMETMGGVGYIPRSPWQLSEGNHAWDALAGFFMNDEGV